ncbi:MAG: diadenylate cyclase CdaA [Clostridia bacterium]|nr:diadenylate cyclase CdaA [Clostridia bacterium]
MDYIVKPISEIGVKDVIDILLLSMLIYALYKFFRRRRAGRMMLGLVVVTLSAILATLIDFPALSYLAELFAGAAFFCAVVIFQPEFRDTLERIGNFSFLNLGRNGISKRRLSAAKATTGEVVDAIYQMAESRTGALIVFEGLTKLGDLVQTGKYIDASLSSHLLLNIFFDKSPLHDGAVIVRDMRVVAASCVLPSSKGKIDFGTMGTRHRAAVGVTEVSDALVVVISEETGVVSVAQNRNLLRDIDRETLKEILLTYIAGNTYLRAKRNTAEARFQSAIDERLQELMNAGRAKVPVAPTVEEALDETVNVDPQTEAVDVSNEESNPQA